jgi:tetratricopeptide (TPR) repeat protein
MQGRYSEAERLLRRSLDTYQGLADVAAKWVRGRSAFGDCKQKYTSVLNRLGRHAQAEAAARDAIAHIEEILQGFPGMKWMQAVCDEAHTELAIALAAQQRWTEVEDVVRSSLAIWDIGDQQRPIARSRRGLNHYRLGLLRFWQEDDQGARGCFDEALRLLRTSEDDLPLAHALSTCPIVDLRDTDHAVSLARAELNPQDARRWQLLGIAQYRQGDYENAVHSLLEAIRRRPNGDAYDFFFLAMSHHQQGDTNSAVEWYRKAVDHLERPTTPVTIYFPAFPRELHDIHTEAQAVLGIGPDGNRP